MAAISTILTAISVVYQLNEARKARAAADARKGQFVSAESQVIALPIVYGRARVAGARVYHYTSNSYNHVNLNSSSIVDPLDIFEGSTGATSYDVEVDPDVEGAFRKPDGKYYKTMTGQVSTELTQNRAGDRHEFLYVEQALCVGPINKCYDVLLEDALTYNREEFKTGLKIVVHREGGTADLMIKANQEPGSSTRNNAIFKDVTHAAMCFKLNRDEPQFSGIPNVNFIIEGRKVRSISALGGNNYSISDTRTYSNNPALCLLDYLLDVDFGAGVSVSQIDLPSFYKAYQACEVNAANATVEGKIWQPTNGYRNITSYTYKRFECNTTLDTSKNIRENVNQLLQCMHNARLVWSGGAFKLAFIYANVETAGIISDDTLARETFDITPPSLDSKQNFCTVRFFDETKDFKEDTATWPPKFGDVYQTFLTNDSGIHLDTDITGIGISSKMLAIAKAEETVRASRRTSKVSFSVIMKDKYYEPGDIVQIVSDALNIPASPAFRVMIDEIALDTSGVAKIKSSTFNETDLAWNVADNVAGEVADVENLSLPPPTNFSFIADSTGSTSGKLSWTDVDDARVMGFKVLRGIAGKTDTTGKQVWESLGETLRNVKDGKISLTIPLLPNNRYVFGVRSYGLYGMLSKIVTTSSQLVAEPGISAPYSLAANISQGFKAIKLTWTNALSTAELARYDKTEIWYTNNNSRVSLTVDSVTGAVLDADAHLAGASYGLEFTHQNLTGGATYKYWARNITKRGTCSVFSNSAGKAVEMTISEYLEAINQDISSDSLVTQILNKNTGSYDTVKLRDYVDSEVIAANDTADKLVKDATEAIYKAEVTAFTNLNKANNLLIEADTALTKANESVAKSVLQIADGTTDIVVKNKDGSTTALSAIKATADSSSGYFADIMNLNVVPGSSAAEKISSIYTKAANSEAQLTDIVNLKSVPGSSVAEKISGMYTSVGANKSTIEEISKMDTSANHAIVSKVTELGGRVGSAEGFIKVFKDVNVNSDSVSVASLMNISAKFATVESYATQSYNSVTNADGSTVSKLESLGSLIGTESTAGKAKIYSDYSTLYTSTVDANSNTSLISRLNTMEASVTGADKTSLSSKLANLTTATVGPTNSLASRLSTLEVGASVPGTSTTLLGKVTELQQATVDTNNSSSLAYKFSSLDAAVRAPGTGLSAQLTELKQARVDDNAAVAQSLFNINATVTTVDGHAINAQKAADAANAKVSTVDSNLTTKYYTKTATDSAISAQIFSNNASIYNTTSVTINSSTAPTTRANSVALRDGDVWIEPQAPQPITTSGGTTYANSIKLYVYTNGNWVYNPDYGSIAAYNLSKAETTAQVAGVSQSQIGYCKLGGAIALSYDNSGSCSAAGGQWVGGAPLATVMTSANIKHNSSVAGVTTLSQAVANVDNTLSASHIVKLTSGNVISGFGIASQYDPGNTKSVTTFAIAADKFFLVAPGVGSVPNADFAPFSAYTTPQTVTRNGVSTTIPPGVYMSMAKIKDLYIERGYIAGGAISSNFGYVASGSSGGLTFYVADNTNFVMFSGTTIGHKTIWVAKGEYGRVAYKANFSCNGTALGDTESTAFASFNNLGVGYYNFNFAVTEVPANPGVIGASLIVTIFYK